MVSRMVERISTVLLRVVTGLARRQATLPRQPIPIAAGDLALRLPVQLLGDVCSRDAFSRPVPTDAGEVDPYSTREILGGFTRNAEVSFERISLHRHMVAEPQAKVKSMLRTRYPGRG